jgi:S1-C subfamily serine protease
VQKRDGVVVICAVDPFSKKNPFKKGDKILQYDGKKITDASVLMQKVLFAPLSSYHTLKIQRAKRRFLVHVKTAKRYGGGFVSDTFLESQGLYFDSKLRLTKITGSFKNYGLLVGDRLIQVNGIKVKTQEELRNYIENFTDYSSLLFERNGFEFFVKIH